MEFHASPFIPLQCAITRKQQQCEKDEYYDANFGRFEQVTTEIVDDGGVQLTAEGEGILFWDGKDGGVEGEA